MGTTAAAGVSPAQPEDSVTKVTAVTWEIPGELCGKPCRHVLDTGAQFTITQKGRIPAQVGESNIKMRQASSSAGLTAMYGPQRVDITLNGITVPAVSVFEADTSDECLLGLDFVTKYTKYIDVEADQLVLKEQYGGHRIQMSRITRQMDAVTHTLRIQCVERTVIPAGDEQCITVWARNCDVWYPEAPTSPADELAIHPREEGVAVDGPVQDGGEARRNDGAADSSGLEPRREGAPQRGTNSDEQPVGAARRVVGQPAESPDPAVDPGGRVGEPRCLPEDVVQVRRMACAAQPVNLPPGLQVTSSLLAADDGHSIQLRVRNTSGQPRVLKRGACVLRLEVTPLAAVSPVQPADAQPDQADKLPEPLEKIAASCAEELTAQQRAQVRALLQEFQDIFSINGEIGNCTLVEHDIDTGTAAPIKQAPRRLAFQQQEVADGCISDMLVKDVITPSNSPWASPVVLLTKKDGKPRFAIDFRQLNSVTRKDAYPLPRIDEMLDSLNGASWFSSLDIRWGYWNIPLAPGAREKTAFCVPGHGLYEFKRMPFGLCNAPATFQRFVDRLLPRHLSRVYLDDIVVPGKNFNEAFACLREVFLAIRSAKFLLNPEKCKLFGRTLEYLGHVINENGVSTDPSKTKKVREWPTPADKENLRSFLGLAQYYAKFVHHFSEIAVPLHRLTEKMRKFEWSPEAQQAFEKLRTALTEAPVLAFPDPNGGLFILDCDASQFALGMVLSQEQKGEERVIAFHGHTLNRHQRNYCVTRRELLAIVEGIKHFHHYLIGRPFRVRTDHAALQWLNSIKHTAEGQLARWLEFIAPYDFTVEHRPGRQHGNADALSRRPCDPGCKHCTRHDHPDAAVVQRVRLVDAHGLSMDDFRVAQATDLDIAPLLAGLREGQRPSADDISDRSERTKSLWLQWRSLEFKGGLLYRRIEDPFTEETKLQLVVPRKLVSAVLRHFHDAPGSGGHFGGYKTFTKIRQRYYWPGMRQEVKLWCLSCDSCSRKKGPQHRTRAPLRVYNVGVPWERVAVDLSGPFPKTARGNTHLLVAVDYFTRWPEALPVPSKHADVVARALVDNIFTRFGSPCELHSDQGRSFEAEVFTTVMELMGTRKTRTTALHPQSDGAVERLIRTLVTQLSLFVDTSQSDWDLQVPMVMMSLRGAPHSTTGVSPAMMLFGREINLPGALVQGIPPMSPPVPSRLRYPGWLRERLQHLHHLVRDRVNSITTRRKERHDLRAKDPQFLPGQLVWLFEPRRRKKRNPKLQSNWTGPFVVVEFKNDVVVKIRLHGNPRAKPRVVHLNRLARCFPRRERE